MKKNAFGSHAAGLSAQLVLVIGLLFAFAPLAFAAFSIPTITSNPDSPYTITSISQTPDRLFPGDEMQLSINIQNAQTSKASNAVGFVKTPFDNGTTNTFSLGDISPSLAKQMIASVTVPANTPPGDYLVYVYASDSVNPQTEVAHFSITVSQPSVSSLLFATVSLDKPALTGESTAVEITLKNTGALDAEDVVVQLLSNSTAPFIPLESDQKYVPLIKAGGSATVSFDIGVSATATPGFYQLPISVAFSVGKSRQPVLMQALGVKIDSKANLLVTSDQGRNSDGSILLTLTIANNGNTAVRSVYANASSKSLRMTGSREKFIGTLNLDDTATMSFSVLPAGGSAGSQSGSGAGVGSGGYQGGNQNSVDVTIYYTDPSNQQHVIQKTIQIDLAANFAASGQTGTAHRGAMGGNNGFLGFSLIQWAGIIAVLAVGGFFGYRWWKKRKEAKKEHKMKA